MAKQQVHPAAVSDTRRTLATNVAFLLQRRREKGMVLDGDGERVVPGANAKSLYNLTRVSDTDKVTDPQLSTIEQVANACNLPVWMLFLPDLPDMITLTPRLAALVTEYVSSDDAARRAIDAVVEATSQTGRYRRPA